MQDEPGRTTRPDADDARPRVLRRRPVPVPLLAAIALVAAFAIVGVAGALERSPAPTRSPRTSAPGGREGSARPTTTTRAPRADDGDAEDDPPDPTTTTRPAPSTTTHAPRPPDPTDPARCAGAWPATAGAAPTITRVATERTAADRALLSITFRSPCGIGFFGDGPPRRANTSSIGLTLGSPCAGSRFTVVSARDPERFGGIGAQDGIPGTCEVATGSVFVSDADLVDGTWADGTVAIPLRLVRCPSNGFLVPSVDLGAWDGSETFVQPAQVAAEWPTAVLACGP